MARCTDIYHNGVAGRIAIISSSASTTGRTALYSNGIYDPKSHPVDIPAFYVRSCGYYWLYDPNYKNKGYFFTADSSYTERIYPNITVWGTNHPAACPYLKTIGTDQVAPCKKGYSRANSNFIGEYDLWTCPAGFLLQDVSLLYDLDHYVTHVNAGDPIQPLYLDVDQAKYVGSQY